MDGSFWREFHKARDNGKNPRISMQDRISQEEEPYEYGELSSRRVLEMWHAGYLRAALLAAAIGITGKGRRQFVRVQIPFRAVSIHLARIHLDRINFDLEEEGFSSLVFEVTTGPDNTGDLTMSLFSREEIQRGVLQAPRTASG